MKTSSYNYRHYQKVVVVWGVWEGGGGQAEGVCVNSGITWVVCSSIPPPHPPKKTEKENSITHRYTDALC